MNKADIICNLKANSYSFEDNGEQIFVRLARGFYLNLYLENNSVVKNEDVVKQFGLTDGKNFKAALKINMIVYLILSLPIVLLCIFNPNFFSMGGKYFIIMIIAVILSQLGRFWYNNNRLSKIKKLLNLKES